MAKAMPEPADRPRNPTKDSVETDFQSGQFQFALVELARDDSADLNDTLAHMCGVAACTLDVARASVWMFNDSHTELRCINLYDRERNVYEKGGVLDVSRFPRYFASLEECRVIAANDARTDPATSEFAPDYLPNCGITSMLDVPIRCEGKVVGVVCHEHIGPSRTWRQAEQNFAASLADLVSLALEADRRRKYNRRLKLLRDIDRAILSVRSVNQIAEAALAHFQQLVACHRASVAVFEPGTGSARLVGVSSDTGTTLGIGTDIPLAAFGDLDELRLGKPLVLDDLNKAMHWPTKASLEADGIRSLVAVPLVAQSELIGTLNLGFTEKGDVSAEDIEIAHEVADSLAVAIGHAHLNSQVERHAEQLEQRVTERTSELSQANAKLQEREERIRSLYDNTPVLMHSLDQHGRVLEVNEHWLRTLGYQRDEVIGHPVTDFAPPESRTSVRDVLLPRLAREGFIKDVEVQGVKKNGELVDLLVSSIVKRDASGNFLHSQTSLLDITEQKRAQNESVYLQEQLASELNFEEIVGTSATMQRVFSSIEIVAQTDATVLLLGETGTGKELIARALHNRSRRKQSVMVKVNCGALPESLVESELFGHEKGAFTGAIAQKKGRFELAHRGTIFLDEIGEVPLETQAKLLRVLQEQEIERLGGFQTIKVDARVIAATNRDLETVVQQGGFRADLFYRLNVFPIEVPPLRERKEDIQLLASYFVKKFSQRVGRRIQGIHRAVFDQFQQYDWPGNVRELANLLERAVILCQGDTILPQHISVSRSKPSVVAESLPTLEEGERRLILRALEQTGGILAGPNGAADLLGINRSTLWSRMRKLGISPPKTRRAGAGN